MSFLDPLLGVIGYGAEVTQLGAIGYGAFARRHRLWRRGNTARRHRLWRRGTCCAGTNRRRGADVASSSAPLSMAPSSVL
jgi:hypothetical protein